MAGFQQNFIYKNRCQAGFGPEVEFDDLWYGCFPHHTVLWCHILEEQKGKIDFGLNSFSRAMSQRPSHTWVCVSHSALGVTETWIMLNTAFSYPSSKGAGQRGQNYGLGINLLIFFTERSLSLLVCVCTCAYVLVCPCVSLLCEHVCGYWRRPQEGVGAPGSGVTGYCGAPDTGPRNLNVVVCMSSLVTESSHINSFLN